MPPHTSSARPKTVPHLSASSQHARSSSSSSRKSSSTHSTPAKPSSSQKLPREFLWSPDVPGTGTVLSYNDQHAFITKPDSWETAVDFAIREFRELQQVERRRITFDKRCCVGQDKILVRITPEAWKSVVPPLVQWEVLEVHVVEDAEGGVIDTHVAVTKKRSRSILGRLFDRSPCSSPSASPSASPSSSRNHSPSRSSSAQLDVPPKYERSSKYEEPMGLRMRRQEPKDENLLSPDWVPPPPPSSRRSKTP